MHVEFGHYRLNRTERLLLGPNGPVDLPARAFDILVMLLDKPDEAVSKSDLFDAIWPGAVAEENTLHANISALRKALDDGLIKTLHGRGYKYTGPRPVATAPDAARAEPADKPSIVVLPFANLSGDATQEIFCQALALNIVGDLGRFHEFLVIDRFSTLAYRNRVVTSAEAADELSVRYVLQGNFQKSGLCIRVSVQLVDRDENRQIWTETYDRQLTDIFKVQDEITGTIVGTLASGYGGRLRKAWRDRRKTSSHESLVALDYLQQALDAFDFTKPGMDRVRELLTRANDIDPGLAKAQSKLAWTHLVDVLSGWAEDHDKALEEARHWALKSLATDDGDSWAHWAFAGYHMLKSNHGVALEAFQRGLECNPNDAEVTIDYALCLGYAGRAEEAIVWALRAMRLNPHHHDWYKAQLGQIYFDARRYDEAINAFAGLRGLDTPVMRLYQAASFAAVGDMENARVSLKRVLDFDVDATLEKWTDPKLAPYGDDACARHFRKYLGKAGLGNRAAQQGLEPAVTRDVAT